MALDSLEQTTLVALGAFKADDFAPDFQSLEPDSASLRPTKVNMYIPGDAINISFNFVELFVDSSRFQAGTVASAPIPQKVRDIFIDGLSKSDSNRIKGFGINHELHFSVADIKVYEAIGFSLMNLPRWANFDINKPRLKAIIIQEMKTGTYPGEVNYRVEISDKVGPRGVVVHVNNHFNVDPSSDNLAVAKIVESVWDGAILNALSFIEKVRSIRS